MAKKKTPVRQSPATIDEAAGAGLRQSPATIDEAAGAGSGRVSVIHLQGPVEERDWLTTLHKKTHLPKATIVRLALAEWAKNRNLPPSPVV